MLQKEETSIYSRTFRLIKPGELREMAIERTIHKGEVVIEPSMASICHADIRYYMGNRRAEALEKKLPMALLHEGIGKVILSKSSDLKVGQRMVIVPNIPGTIIGKGEPEECSSAQEKGFRDNYSEKNEFLGSGYDGIAQSCLVLPAQCAIPIPDTIPDEIAVLCELCTISYRAVSRVKEQLMMPNTKVAVFGDGPVGYLTAALISHMYRLDSSRLKVFGAVDEKIAHFHFADCSMVQDFDFCSAEKVDIVIDCTGGKFSESAVNQGIEILKRGGALLLMGVSEEKVPINTRDILEKGLSLFGSSRSSIEDFHIILSAMQDLEYQELLRAILPEEFTSIRTVQDFKMAMDSAGQHREWQRVILEFNWTT